MANPARFLTVARREYIERVRTKAFVIATLIGPLLTAFMLIGPALLASRQRDKPTRLALIAPSAPVRAAVEQALQQRREPRFTVVSSGEGPVETERPRLRQQVLAGQLDGYLYLPADVLTSSAGEYYGKSVSNLGDMRMLERVVEEALVAQRLAAEGVAAGRVKSVMRRLDLKTIRITERGEREDRGVTFIFASVMMMMLYIS